MTQKNRYIFLLTLAACWIGFKIFLFSPVVIYSTNLEEMGVSLGSILWRYILPCLALVAVLAGLGLILSQRLRERYIMILVAIGLLLWLQGDILLWKYGQLDGTFIDWTQGKWRGFVDSIVWIGVIFVCFRWYKELIQTATLALGLLVAVQLTSLWFAGVGTALSSEARNILLSEAPPEQLFQFGEAENVVHILLDGFQSTIFEELASGADSEGYSTSFEGFTFFREATTTSAVTYISAPSFLSGSTYRNDTTVWDFRDQALEGKNIASVLAGAGYEIDIAVGTAFSLKSHKDATYYRIPHPFQSLERTKVYQTAFMLDLSLFRLAPHFLKQFIYNDQSWLVSSVLSDEGNVSNSSSTTAALRFPHFSDNAFLNELTTHSSIGERERVYKYIHLVTPHPPIVVDENDLSAKKPLEYDKENFKRQSAYTMRNVIRYLDKLREMGIYDSSTIIIHADHGGGVPFEMQAMDSDQLIESTVGGVGIWGGMLPLLLVKPKNSTGPLKVSQAPVELNDIPATIVALLELSERFDGKNVFDVGVEEARDRKYYFELSHRNDAAKVGYFEALQEYVVSGSVFLESSWRVGKLYVKASGEKTPTYLWGSRLTFGKNGTVLPYLVDGWSNPEKETTWTDGNEAKLKIRIEPAKTGAVSLSARLLPFVDEEKLPAQHVDVNVNGEHVGTWTLDQPSVQVPSMTIPAELLQQEEMVLSFGFPNAAIPKVLGIDQDVRTLAALFQYVSLTDDNGHLVEMNSKADDGEGRQSDQERPQYYWGNLLTFGKDGTVGPYLLDGWSLPDEKTTWTSGHEARLKLRVSSPETAKISLTVKLLPFLHQDKLSSQPVEITVNRKRVGSWTLTEAGVQTRSLAIPAKFVREPTLVLGFKFPNAAVPKDLRVNEDARRLAALFQYINLADDGGGTVVY